MRSRNASLEFPDLIAAIANATDCNDLIKPFAAAMETFGFDLISYYSLQSGFRNHSFDESVVEPMHHATIGQMFAEAGGIDFDAAFRRKLQRLAPFHLHQLANEPDASPEIRHIINAFVAHDVIDAICVPVTSAIGNISVFGLSARGVKFDLSDEDMIAIQMICEAIHRRRSELVDPPDRNPANLLSPREQEVASLMTGGLSNKEIARALDISAFTVDTFVRRIFEKLGVNNRIEAAVHYVLMAGLPSAARP